MQRFERDALCLSLSIGRSCLFLHVADTPTCPIWLVFVSGGCAVGMRRALFVSLLPNRAPFATGLDFINAFLQLRSCTNPKLSELSIIESKRIRSLNFQLGTRSLIALDFKRQFYLDQRYSTDRWYCALVFAMAQIEPLLVHLYKFNLSLEMKRLWYRWVDTKVVNHNQMLLNSY